MKTLVSTNEGIVDVTTLTKTLFTTMLPLGGSSDSTSKTFL